MSTLQQPLTSHHFYSFTVTRSFLLFVMSQFLSVWMDLDCKTAVFFANASDGPYSNERLKRVKKRRGRMVRDASHSRIALTALPAFRKRLFCSLGWTRSQLNLRRFLTHPFNFTPFFNYQCILQISDLRSHLSLNFSRLLLSLSLASLSRDLARGGGG